MSATFSLDASALDSIAHRLQETGGDVEDAINEVLHGQAGRLIADRISSLIHPSGRTFKGHSASAAASDWPRFGIAENLAVEVGTKARFGYLYFPDDGSNTKRHVGDQRFMERGAEAAAGDITDLCIGAIMKRLETA